MSAPSVKSPPARGLTPASVQALDERLVLSVMKFAERWSPGTMKRAQEVFGPSPDGAIDLPLFLAWSVFHFRVDGRSLTERFLVADGENGGALHPLERGWLEAQARAWVSLWQVTGLPGGASLELRDLLTGEARTVLDENAAKILEAGDAVLGRVVDHDGASWLRGISKRLLPAALAEPLARALRAELMAEDDGVLPVEELRQEGVDLLLLDGWHRALLHLDAQAEGPLEGPLDSGLGDGAGAASIDGPVDDLPSPPRAE